MYEFNHEQFRISSAHQAELNALYALFAERSAKVLGYPANLLYDYSDLYRFFSFTVNNVGDPFVKGLYDIHTHSFEREVISFFAELYHAPHNDYWGYVTNGGTEGNMYGLYLARESLPSGIAYFSEDTHYSIKKAVRVLGLANSIIKSQQNGEIDYEDLEEKVKTNREKPPIIVANIGTTIKGAVDRVEKIADILHRNAIQRFYIHCDAALGGMILPFVDKAPLFDFRMPIRSLSLSGHKMLGSPMPCGIVIARKKDVERIQQLVEYIGAPDTTLSGSRNGHAVLFLWYTIRRFGYEGFKKMITSCMETTRYALKRLEEISWDAHVEKYSVSIGMKRPSEEIVMTWQLA
ncbi:MAG: histidine decarboxylase, partial [Patescibacteria group bacterium]